MKELITIVIPCKNERELIGKTLSYLDNQNDISGVNVIIADSSTDDTMDIVVRMSFKNINVTFTDGGIPSVARNNGADLVKTPYVLFLDADMFLVNPDTIKDCLVEADKYDLISCRFRINGEYSFVFPAFEFVRDLFMWYPPTSAYQKLLKKTLKNPIIKKINNVLYLNSGDWVENFTALTLDSNGTWHIFKAD